MADENIAEGESGPSASSSFRNSLVVIDQVKKGIEERLQDAEAFQVFAEAGDPDKADDPDGVTIDVMATQLDTVDRVGGGTITLRIMCRHKITKAIDEIIVTTNVMPNDGFVTLSIGRLLIPTTHNAVYTHGKYVAAGYLDAYAAIANGMIHFSCWPDS